MQITIDVPEYLVRDYEAKTGRKLDIGYVEVAVRAYYMRLYDPSYDPDLSPQALAALYGDNDCR